MKKNKFILMATGVFSTLAAVPVIAAACSRNIYNHPKSPTTSVVNIKLNPNLVATADQKKDLPRIVMINDGGDINDKSFNQAAWEGLLNFVDKQNNISQRNYNVLEVTGGNYKNAYTQALNSGYKIWIMPGFLHSDQIASFIKEGNNAARMKELGVVILGADYATELKGHGIFQEFKTKEAAFAAGYAAAKFLSEEPNAADRTFAQFGGGNFAGVTDFNEGFMKGVLYWNEQQTDENKKVHTTQNTVDLSVGFDTNSAQLDTAISNILATNPKLILPVAGQATYSVMRRPEFKNRYIVGVDTDQALAAPSGKSAFFTSILKNLGQSTYDLVGAVALNTKTKEELGGFVLREADGHLNGGFSENWVDLSKTYIEGEKGVKAQQALDEAKRVASNLPEDVKSWLYSNKATKSGEEISDINTRMNALAAALFKAS
ncbi:BMP family ABC transporter substrate-binding protein [Mycoplasmopsis phocirhinis]|uniref:BMP family ABC transporter substrate-binding protein n=1 Tax=Mycoplasmopsis phocirhinis TaxID=142650 RepID=A0A4V0ZAI6_9BACT|nr:BMP family ABC transporter substrate-binding protein [Mycoplasmopsis phocirhinis]QBF34832.1 BMP family ABC transporter substrate-binding protein [Mycoplasmopsis phocirhinis]